jgi:hypothetical protein
MLLIRKFPQEKAPMKKTEELVENPARKGEDIKPQIRPSQFFLSISIIGTYL